MDRRRYLTSVAVAIGALFAGCNGGEPDGGSTGTEAPTPTQGGLDARPTEGSTDTGEATPGAIPEAPVADSMTGWERRDDDAAGGERLEDADDPPSVDFEPENDRLYVRGVILVGSSSCNEPAVHEIEYDEGELSVYVLPDRKESVRDDTPRECTSDMSADAYDVVVTFDDGLPERVVAEEGDAEAEERRSVYER